MDDQEFFFGSKPNPITPSNSVADSLSAFDFMNAPTPYQRTSKVAPNPASAPTINSANEVEDFFSMPAPLTPTPSQPSTAPASLSPTAPLSPVLSLAPPIAPTPTAAPGPLPPLAPTPTSPAIQPQVAHEPIVSPPSSQPVAFSPIVIPELNAIPEPEPLSKVIQPQTQSQSQSQSKPQAQAQAQPQPQAQVQPQPQEIQSQSVTDVIALELENSQKSILAHFQKIVAEKQNLESLVKELGITITKLESENQALKEELRQIAEKQAKEDEERKNNKYAALAEATSSFVSGLSDKLKF